MQRDHTSFSAKCSLDNLTPGCLHQPRIDHQRVPHWYTDRSIPPKCDAIFLALLPLVASTLYLGLIHHGCAAPVCAHPIRQARRLGIPASAPSMATTRVSTSTPNVTHELTVAPSCTAASAFSACCRARSAYCARKVRASAATWAGFSRTAATRSRNWTSAVRASSVDMPV